MHVWSTGARDVTAVGARVALPDVRVQQWSPCPAERRNGEAAFAPGSSVRRNRCTGAGPCDVGYRSTRPTAPHSASVSALPGNGVSFAGRTPAGTVRCRGEEPKPTSSASHQAPTRHRECSPSRNSRPSRERSIGRGGWCLTGACSSAGRPAEYPPRPHPRAPGLLRLRAGGPVEVPEVGPRGGPVYRLEVPDEVAGIREVPAGGYLRDSQPASGRDQIVVGPS